MKNIDINKLDIFQIAKLRDIIVKLHESYTRQIPPTQSHRDLPDWQKNIVENMKKTNEKIGRLDEIIEKWVLNELFKEED